MSIIIIIIIIINLGWEEFQETARLVTGGDWRRLEETGETGGDWRDWRRLERLERLEETETAWERLGETGRD